MKYNFLFIIILLSVWSCSSPEKTVEQPALSVITFDDAKAKELAQRIEQEVKPTLAEGLEMSIWASDSMLFDPVALNIDAQGRVYVTSTTRGGNSEFDVRGHLDWMTESISFQTVEDRRDFLHRTFAAENSEKNKWFPDLNKDSLHDWHDLAIEKDCIIRLEDKSGDGLADHSQKFIEDFHEEITDVANGILAHEDDVFVSIAPDVWRLKDTNGDGQADSKTSISHGWGVHIGFGGHGMSGLTVGPDGKIWWGIGDIGMNVTDKDGKQWEYPNEGVIVRCNPDGSDFEVFASGLRNTHEFVFDEYGNLITADNDGDHPGEQERLVYLIDGSDSGWRINWQFGKYTDPDNNDYKVWMEEEMYKPRFEQQAAYILPPIRNFHSGPAGMKYNPGTALGEKWKNKFFLVEFNGNPARSGIHAFDLQPKGAGFELKSEQQIMSGVLAVGMDFGPDGALYMNDWIDGWGVKGHARVWKMDVPEAEKDQQRPKTKELIQADFKQKDEKALSELLHYPDMRIRQKAQFELVKRANKGYETLLAAAKQTEHQLARVHALWGIGQLSRKDKKYTSTFEQFLKDSDPEIIAQAVKLIGDIRINASSDKLIPLLKHTNDRVRFFAAEALGRTANKNAVQPILDLLATNDDKDIYFRQVGAIALSRIGQAEPLLALTNHPSKPVRIAAVVALRRMKNPKIANFLKDADEYIVTETARAINDDLSIEAALPALAMVLKETRFTNEALLRRAINANSRVGKPENIALLKEFAMRKDAPAEMRAEALATLGVWAKPSVLDRVDGRYRGVVERDNAPVLAALESVINDLLNENQPVLQVAAAQTVGRLKLNNVGNTLLALVQKNKVSEVRIAALKSLNAIAEPSLDKALETALSDKDTNVRATALSILPDSKLPEDRVVQLFDKVLKQGSVPEQQAALEALGRFKGAAAIASLNSLMDKLLTNKLKPEIQLDVLEAARNSNDPTLVAKLTTYEGQLAKDDVLAPYKACLTGGDAQRGREIMAEHQGAQCMRCHAVFEWGGDVGPNLSNIGAKYNALQLLESVIEPSAKIADGYGVAILTMNDGETLSGIVEAETTTEIVLKMGATEKRTIEKNKIKERTNAPSSMPSMATILKKREIRDLVAFLGTLKESQLAKQ